MRLRETERMVATDADRGQQNERQEGLEEAQVINVVRGERRGRVQLTRSRKCLHVIIMPSVTKVSHLW